MQMLLNRPFKMTLSALFMLSTTSTFASDCSVLRLQMSRNPGTKISNNHCTAETDLSLGAIIELQSGGRIWLESSPNPEGNNSYQIICQNQKAAPLKLKLSATDSPWLQAVDMPNCNGWNNNRLMCAPLICAIAVKPNPNRIHEFQPQTSVTMRSISPTPKNPSSGNDHKQLAELVKPSIDLCREVYATKQNIKLSWTITAMGAVSNALVNDATADADFNACALEALQNSHFPATNTSDLAITWSF